MRGPLVVGLIASAERIAQIRRHRLLSLKESRSTDYVDPRLITDELMAMKNLCSNNDWPMIDVTRRSVEETAATILNMLSDTKRLDKSMIILASTSPTRQAMLRNAGLAFTAVSRCGRAELVPASRWSPEETALKLAEAKALDVSARIPHAVVIGADQVLALGGKIYGETIETSKSAVSNFSSSGARKHALISAASSVPEAASSNGPTRRGIADNETVLRSLSDAVSRCDRR